MAQWCNLLTLQPEQSGGVGSVPGGAPPFERCDKRSRTRLAFSYFCDPSASRKKTGALPSLSPLHIDASKGLTHPKAYKSHCCKTESFFMILGLFLRFLRGLSQQEPSQFQQVSRYQSS